MKQLKLFSELQPNCSKRFPQLEMSVGTLHQWKQRIFDYQQSAPSSQPQQQTLFELAPNPCNVDTLDPFALQLHNLSFCDQPDWGDRTCLYFAMAVAPAIAYDTAKPTPLLLYVGETERSPKQRWMNHYCHRYIGNYIEMHRRYSLDVAVGIAFWFGAPINRKQQLKLESELIYRWRSP